MPNDFKPAVGHRFTFRARPFRALGFDGTVRCEVLELEPPKRMVWAWAGGNIDTTVTFTLEQTAEGGYPRILGQRLPAYLGQTTAGPDATPSAARCEEGSGHSLLAAFRRPNR